MFWTYVKERRTWILFFVMMQAWLNFLAYMDVGFSVHTLRYLNLINPPLFVIFFMWRYVRESSSFRLLLEESEDDLLRPFDEKIAARFRKHKKELQMKINDYETYISEERDRTIAWIHDIKTPLTVQKLLIDNMEDDEYKRRLELEWNRTYQLIDQELYMIRLESIHEDNRMAKVALANVVRKEVQSVRTWCIEKGVGIDVELDELPTVLSDQKWTEYIIRQILTNAVKYSPNDGIIYITSDTNTSGHTFLHIRDEGNGIKPEDVPRIFNKSFTGSDERKTNGATGMGLYLAKQSAESLGIHIIVQTTVGEGSTFTLQFPIENDYNKTLHR